MQRQIACPFFSKAVRSPMKTVGPPYSGKLHVRWDGKGMVT